jgi:hypothetical protein
MKVDGYIGITAHHTPLGDLERLTYEWQGGPRVILHDRVFQEAGYKHSRLRAGKVVSIGPWRLRLIERRVEHRGWVVMQDGWRSWLRCRWQPQVYRFEWVYRRLIVTMALWNLARWNGEGAVPTWRDIYLLAWICKRVQFR